MSTAKSKHELAMLARRKKTEKRFIGQVKFGIECLGRATGPQWKWWFSCHCNKVFVASIDTFRNDRMKSCGCTRYVQKKGSEAHGYVHGGYVTKSKPPTFETYTAMISRCYSPTSDSYDNYGGKGITVCEEWLDNYANFLEDMGPRPEGKTIDRLDGTKNYYKENCRWATPTQQSRNRPSNKLTMDLARQIRLRKLKYDETANQIREAMDLTCSDATVRRVISGVIWKEDAV